MIRFVKSFNPIWPTFWLENFFLTTDQDLYLTCNSTYNTVFSVLIATLTQRSTKYFYLYYRHFHFICLILFFTSRLLQFCFNHGRIRTFKIMHYFSFLYAILYIPCKQGSSNFHSFIHRVIKFDIRHWWYVWENTPS